MDTRASPNGLLHERAKTHRDGLLSALAVGSLLRGQQVVGSETSTDEACQMGPSQSPDAPYGPRPADTLDSCRIAQTD